jgi:peroxiredoxin Q/BCP
MIPMNMITKRSLGSVSLLIVVSYAATMAAAEPAPEDRTSRPPSVGDTAQDFELTSISGEQTKLSALTKKGPVVLVVLRGFPGYQCPVCNAQVGEFLAKAKAFQASSANVVLVYPGPAAGLKDHANEFVRGKTLPENFYLLLDPDYTFTSKYHLRWDAPGETAYPSTFVIDSSSKVRFAQISKSHGGRAKASAVLETLAKK